MSSSPNYRGATDKRFPSPFLDYSSLAMPDNFQDLLYLCEHIFAMGNGSYRRANERIISYFLTEVDIGAASKPVGVDERDRWSSFLNDDLGINLVQKNKNMDVACYGNWFGMLYVPFMRFLGCPRCHTQWRLSEIAENPRFKFKFENFEFVATCPRCHTGGGYRGPLQIHDRPLATPEHLTVRSFSPHEINLSYCPTSGDMRYYWRIPEDYRRLIQEGRSVFHLERVDTVVLEAIKRRQVIQFADDVLYHSKEPTLSGLRNRGWGFSRTLANMKQIWYVQLLHRSHEAIALDYVVPFRLITPAATNGTITGDPMKGANAGATMYDLRRMLARHRLDPTGYHTLGHPVQYQLLGGDAKQMAPVELLQYGIDNMHDAAGIPVEFQKGTVQIQVAPLSLRWFEATWFHLVHDNQQFLRWLVRRASKILNWPPVAAKHRRVTHADDMQRHMAVLQMAMGGSVSMTTALRMLNLDFRDEQRTMSEEARFQQQQQARMQKELEQAAFGEEMAAGGPAQPTPGQPAGGAQGIPGTVDPATGQPTAMGPVAQLLASGNMPNTPEDILATADAIASELLGKPEAMKDSELRALKQKAPVIHASVIQALDAKRSQTRMQGGAMLMGQAGGGSPALA